MELQVAFRIVHVSKEMSVLVVIFFICELETTVLVMSFLMHIVCEKGF